MANIPGMQPTWNKHPIHYYFFISSNRELTVKLGWYGNIPGW